MQRLLLILVALLLLPTLSRADSILDKLRELPLKEGVTYDFTHDRFLNSFGLSIVGYDPIGIDLTWIGIDGIGATLDFNLASLPVKNVPILKYVKYLNIGYTAGYRTMTLTDVTGNPKSDNQFIQGPTVFFKVNF